MGRRTEVIASGEKLAKVLKRELKNYKKGENRYYVSDLTEHFERLAERILKEKIKIERCTIY